MPISFIAAPWQDGRDTTRPIDKDVVALIALCVSSQGPLTYPTMNYKQIIRLSNFLDRLLTTKVTREAVSTRLQNLTKVAGE